jgi:hypothetical protein
MRRAVVIVDDFYDDPLAVRRYALAQNYYFPYHRDAQVYSGKVRPNWMTASYREHADCPFKGSALLRAALESATGEKIDMDHWRLGVPLDGEGKADSSRLHEEHGCLWNCSFHVKLHSSQQLGDGVHNHVTDAWNCVGIGGWTGLLYLSPDAPLAGGLRLWRNRDPKHRFDWMTDKGHWELIDELGNVFNRLLLVRGDIPHSGAAGWGQMLGEGRMFQTFFFKVRRPTEQPAVKSSQIIAAHAGGLDG